jgi:hypothetical protein
MPKVVFRSLRKRSSGQQPARSVGKERVRGPKGESRIVYKLDANSASFDEDFRYVFGKNVAKARKDNRRIAGAAGAARKR